MTHDSKSILKMIILENVPWVGGSVFGSVISWNMIGQSVLSIITALVITGLSFFLNRYLKKKFDK